MYYPSAPGFRFRHLVEVTDARDRPLLLLPGDTAARRGLRHRVVLLAVRDRAGRVLVRGGADGLWHVSAAGRVRVGEAREETARRLLDERLGLRNLPLTRGAGLAASVATGFRQLTLFLAGPSAAVSPGRTEDAAGRLFLDRDEMEGLAAHYPDLLASDLLWAVETGCLFPAARRSRSS